MKAMILDRFGGVDGLRWGQWPMPQPGAGEVRIRIRAVSVNPVDCKMRKGLLAIPLPNVLGRDVAGVVDAVGDGVREFRAGDEVVAVLFGPRSNGAYAQYVTTAAAFVASKPAGLSDGQAAVLGVAGLTAYAAVGKGAIQPGEAALVAGGAGGVGSFALSLLRHRGATPILATVGGDASAQHLAQTQGLAEGHLIRYRELNLEQMAERVRDLTRGRGVAAAFDFVGADMKRLCFAATGFDGRVVSVVEEAPGFDLDIWRAGGPLFEKSGSYHFVALSARGRNGGPGDWGGYRRGLTELGALVQTRKVALPMITEMGPLNEANLGQAHELLESGRAKGKLVLTVEH